MTREEWEKQQSVVRRVYDPDTGRHRSASRLIRFSYFCTKNDIFLPKKG